MPSVTTLPFVGGELASFDPNDSSTAEITSTNIGGTPTYNGSYSRCALACRGVNGFSSPTWTATSPFWCHFVWNTDGFGAYGGPGNAPTLYLYNGATVVAQLLFSNAGYLASYGYFQLQTLQGSVMTSVGSPAVISQDTLQTVDVQITAGASGSAALYIAGTVVASATGLNHASFSGVTQLSALAFNSVSLQTSYWSQIICDTSSTVGRFLITDNFDTESAVNTGWTGSGGASKLVDINDVPNSDVTFIYAASASLTDTFYQSTLSLGTYYILGRAVSARARVQGAGPANIKLTTRVSGTNYTTANIALSPGYTAVAYTWTVNPATSAVWTPAQAQGIELGVQSAT